LRTGFGSARSASSEVADLVASLVVASAMALVMTSACEGTGCTMGKPCGGGDDGGLGGGDADADADAFVEISFRTVCLSKPIGTRRTPRRPNPCTRGRGRLVFLLLYISEALWCFEMAARVCMCSRCSRYLKRSK